MKLIKFITAGMLVACIIANPARYSQRNNNARAQVDVIDGELPTSVTNYDDIVNLFNALRQRHEDDIVNFAEDETSEYRSVMDKLKNQIEQGHNAQQKIHNTKLVLINNHNTFGMKKSEMVRFIRDNKSTIDHLAQRTDSAKVIDRYLDETIQANVNQLKSQIKGRVDEIQDDNVRNIANKFIHSADEFVSNNEDIQEFMDNNGNENVRDFGISLISIGRQWLNDNYNVEDRIESKKEEIKGKIDSTIG